MGRISTDCARCSMSRTSHALRSDGLSAQLRLIAIAAQAAGCRAWSEGIADEPSQARLEGDDDARARRCAARWCRRELHLCGLLRVEVAGCRLALAASRRHAPLVTAQRQRSRLAQTSRRIFDARLTTTKPAHCRKVRPLSQIAALRGAGSIKD